MEIVNILSDPVNLRRCFLDALSVILFPRDTPITPGYPLLSLPLTARSGPRDDIFKLQTLKLKVPPS